MFIGNARVRTKMQLTLPSRVCKESGLTEGTDLLVFSRGEEIVLRKSSEFKPLFESPEEMERQTGVSKGELMAELKRQRLIIWSRMKKEMEARQRKA